MRRKAYLFIGELTFVLATVLLLSTYFNHSFPKLFLEKTNIIGSVGLFIPSITAILVLVFDSKMNKIVSWCMNVFFALSLAFFFASCIIILIVPIFMSETTATENYLQFDNFPNERKGNIEQLFPEYIPDEAKSVSYHYCYYCRIGSGFEICLEMELPPDIYENEKQRIMKNKSYENVHGIRPCRHGEAGEGFTAIVLREQGKGYDQTFLYCDEQMKVKYMLWSLGW